MCMLPKHQFQPQFQPVFTTKEMLYRIDIDKRVWNSPIYLLHEFRYWSLQIVNSSSHFINYWDKKVKDKLTVLNKQTHTHTQTRITRTSSNDRRRHLIKSLLLQITKHKRQDQMYDVLHKKKGTCHHELCVIPFAQAGFGQRRSNPEKSRASFPLHPWQQR